MKVEKWKRVVLYWETPIHDHEENLPFKCLADKDDEWIKGMFMELLGIEYDPDICRWEITDYYEKEVSA